jgi:hypothetical protein
MKCTDVISYSVTDARKLILILLENLCIRHSNPTLKFSGPLSAQLLTGDRLEIYSTQATPFGR